MKSLTDYELKLVADAGVLRTKTTIIGKVYDLFGELAETYKEVLEQALPNVQLTSNAKISKGENYQGLPYVMLDYPRQFGRVDVLAIRSFFWWGNFFSITLHLSGQYLQQYARATNAAINNQDLHNWYIGKEKQWEHYFEEDNYTLLTNIGNADIAHLPFLKLAKKIPLTKWDEADKFFIESFRLLAKLLST